MACEGSAGVEKTFTMRRRRVAGSIHTQSVKVPPVSIATRRGWERRGMSAEDRVASGDIPTSRKERETWGTRPFLRASPYSNWKLTLTEARIETSPGATVDSSAVELPL
jgi:hypothetical protein